MDGVLLLDKPTGPTSHDVVARLRSVTGERSVGHTGTLDPMATGLLLIVFGSATRLSAHLTGGDKTYDAVVRLGFATDTDDAFGQPLGSPASQLPDDATIAAAVDQFRGTFDQVPPAHSAKKVGGKKAYDAARADAPLTLDAVSVTVSTLTYGGCEGDRVRLTVSASAGFYVRALARDLGQVLGCAGHLAELRRTHSGTFDVAQAIPLADAERLGQDVAARLLSPAEALSELPAVTLTELGLRRALHGNPLGPQHLANPWIPPGTASAGPQVRVLDATGRLIALAHSRGGALHPAVVLG
jgi:tRNA pseudouridine55 synthase